MIAITITEVNNDNGEPHSRDLDVLNCHRHPRKGSKRASKFPLQTGQELPPQKEDGFEGLEGEPYSLRARVEETKASAGHRRKARGASHALLEKTTKRKAGRTNITTAHLLI